MLGCLMSGVQRDNPSNLPPENGTIDAVILSRHADTVYSRMTRVSDPLVATDTNRAPRTRLFERQVPDRATCSNRSEICLCWSVTHHRAGRSFPAAVRAATFPVSNRPASQAAFPWWQAGVVLLHASRVGPGTI